MHPRLFIILPCYKLIQWRIQGGPPPTLFLDQTEAQGAEKIFWETAPPLCKGLDDRLPALSQGLDPALPIHSKMAKKLKKKKKRTISLTCLHNDHTLACMISELKEKGYQLDLKSLQ